MEALWQQMYGTWIAFVHNKQLGYSPSKEETLLHQNLSRALQAHARGIELVQMIANQKWEKEYESGSGGNSPGAS